MLVIPIVPLLLSALNSAVGLERQSLSSNLPKLKRGVIETGHNVHRLRSIGPSARSVQQPGSLAYRNVKIFPQESAYKDVFKPSSPYADFPVAQRSSESQSNEHSTTHPKNLFTISAGYKVAGDSDNVKPFRQTGTNVQVPVYKTGYPLAKATDAQPYGPAFQNGKGPSTIFLPQKSQESPPAYSSSFQQGHALVANPRGHRFDFTGRTPKANGNGQPGAPFLSPLSSFQGQVVAIPTAANNPQFPQYKGATVEVYPTVGGFATVAYQALQAQPQLHFGHGNVQHVQPVGEPRQPPSRSEEIRSDVEIIDKKRPRPPPKKDDDGDEDEDDEGYPSHGKHYGVNSNVDSDYRPKPGKYFKSSPTESDFKPSTSFPFKQYDETFGKYATRNRDEETEGKPFAKYHAYSTTNDDKDDEDEPSGRYRTEDSSPKSYYGNKEDEEEAGEDDDGGHEYEKQRTEESSDGGQGSKYFDKDFDEEFEASYRREAPNEKYSRSKDVSEYGSRPSRRSKDDYETEGPSDQSSRKRMNYRKISPNFDDTEGHGSDISASSSTTTIHAESFGHRIPRKTY